MGWAVGGLGTDGGVGGAGRSGRHDAAVASRAVSRRSFRMVERTAYQRLRRLQLQYRLDLDAGAQRQRGHPDGGAGVPAGLAQHVYEKLRRAVDDEVLFAEVRVTV